MYEAWIGFAGNLVGSALAALIAICVMRKTNEANNKIAERNAKINFANKLTSITAEFCSSPEKLRTINMKKRVVEAEQKMHQLTKYNDYVEDIEKLNSKIISVVHHISTSIFEAEIMFMSQDDFTNKITYFHEIKNDALSNITKREFNEHLDNFKAEIADSIKEYIR